jgi:eukaryotic-like serine/threonine-protein kinase
VDLPLAREIAAREGIKAVVSGSVAAAGSGFIITARLINAQSGDELALAQESASSTADIIPAVDRLTRELRGRIGESLKSVKDAPALAQVATSSLDALRSYAAGARANDVEGDYPKAIPLFEDAIAKDSGFAAAYVQLANTLANAGLQLPRQDSLRVAAYRLRARLPEHERYSVEGSYFWKRDRPKAIAAYQRAVASDSSDVESLNQLAIISEETRDEARAEKLFRRAAVVEPANGILLENLAAALLNQGKFDAADSVYRAIKASKIPFPVDADEANLFYRRGELDSAEARYRAGTRSPNAQLSRVMLYGLRQVLQVRGRLREADSLGVEIRARNIARGAQVDQLTLPLRRAFDDAFLRGQNQQAIARIDSALRAQPLTAKSSPGTILDAATNYAFAGAPEKARPILAQYDAMAADSVKRESWRGQRSYAEASILLAERRTDDAIRAFRRMDTDADGLPNSCTFCLPVSLARAYDQANVTDSTIVNLERYLANLSDARTIVDTWFLGPAHKRLGELYEAKGNAKRAADEYAAFVELWKRADPDQQPKVAEVRARLERVRRTLPH